jgi:hypothetical protein
VIEAQLIAEGAQTRLVWEVRGMPVNLAPSLRRGNPNSRRAPRRLHQRSRAPQRRGALERNSSEPTKHWASASPVSGLWRSERSTIGRVDEFVPHDFDVPQRLETPLFVLEPLHPEHNDQDYDAWTSSMEHIHATPGWQDSNWPGEMTPHENHADLQRHADDFRNRTGFTYTVLDPASRDVIGCVYIYPQRDGDYDAHAHSWVRASHAHLDALLWRAVSEWLASDWLQRTLAHRSDLPLARVERRRMGDAQADGTVRARRSCARLASGLRHEPTDSSDAGRKVV